MRAHLTSTVMLLVLFLLSACAHGDFFGGGEDELDRSVAPPLLAAEDPDPSSVLPRLEVDGLVRDAEDDHSVVGRSVTCVDANGKRSDALTAEDGAFHLDGIAPPYDLMVAGDGVSSAAVIMLGVTRPDPHVEVHDAGGVPRSRPAAQSLRLTLDLQPCPSRACFVSVVSSSSSGEGGLTLPYEDAGARYLAIEHRWRKAPGPAEELTVHALSFDASRATFAYAAHAAIAAAPGEIDSLGAMTLSPVESGGPVVAAARAPAVPLGWAWGSAAWLDFPGGGSISLGFEEGPALAFRAPRISGATIRATTWAELPRQDAQPENHRFSQVWSGARSVSSSPEAIGFDVPLGPELVRPTTMSALSRRGPGFEWTALDTRALCTLSILELTRGRTPIRVLTSGHAVSFAKLAVLGAPRLETGDHVLDLTTAFGYGVDDATAPDVALRRRRFDLRAAGEATYVRAPFRVVR